MVSEKTAIALTSKLFIMNTECPECGSEDAFHNGVTYECPDCGYEW